FTHCVRLLQVIVCPPRGPAPPAIDTLSLHDALPISSCARPSWSTSWPEPPHRPREHDGAPRPGGGARCPVLVLRHPVHEDGATRSEEHTSELQSRENLVCRLLLEKKNNRTLH